MAASIHRISSIVESVRDAIWRAGGLNGPISKDQLEGAKRGLAAPGRALLDAAFAQSKLDSERAHTATFLQTLDRVAQGVLELDRDKDEFVSVAEAKTRSLSRMEKLLFIEAFELQF